MATDLEDAERFQPHVCGHGDGMPEQVDDKLDLTVVSYARLSECPGMSPDEVREYELPEDFAFLVNRCSG